MKASLLFTLFLSLPFLHAQDLPDDDTDKGNKLNETFLVSQGAKNKALLMRIFNAVREVEDEKKAKGKRTLEVRHCISSTEFLVSAGGATEYWFIALQPKNLNNRDRFKTDAVLTDDTKTFRNRNGETIKTRVLKEVASKPVPPFTKDEFVQRLKDGETWTLMDFEQRKCKSCGGDGMVLQGEQLDDCTECHEGRISIDYVVKWW